MPSFSKKSLSHLSTCHDDLQDLFKEVVVHFDCTVLAGYRNKEEQETAFRNGMTQLRFPHGKHNKSPSLAADVIPYPIDWKDRERLHYFAGFVKGVANGLDIDIRWGGDWDSDTEVRDNSFDDLVHFELRQG